jgi:hypothetical protein
MDGGKPQVDISPFLCLSAPLLQQLHYIHITLISSQLQWCPSPLKKKPMVRKEGLLEL